MPPIVRSKLRGELQLPLFHHLREREMVLKIVPRKEHKVNFDFLEPELVEFIEGVTDLTRKRWLNDYTEAQIADKILDAYEWCFEKDFTPKSVGGLMRKFFSDVPKKSLGAKTAKKLDALLSEGRDA